MLAAIRPRKKHLCHFTALLTLGASPCLLAEVTDETLRNAADSGEEWVTYGRDYYESRYSPLDQINEETVTELGVAWTFDTGSHRGLEASPLVHDGVLYGTRPWSSVFALDARSGEVLWEFDPQVDRALGWKACCDVVNRGVALYEGKVYVGTIDGRLIALDASNGNPVWQVQTTDPDRPYTITGAPRIADGKVVIGNGGSEMGVRGYVTAYDAETGNEAWRFWVVPGNPADGFENPDMELAATTWSGEWWEVGGGGTAWDSIVYDPEARLVYVGTGNGSPWSHEIRSDGQGDNLYLSSIVALNVDNGRVVWHYQTTPGDNWDYTAVQPLMLADLDINGIQRKVIMQAPKNGFFYVLDRLSGELISADPFSHVTWAKGIDLESGRPIETAQARYDRAVALISPGPGGAHNWHPMSYNPNTGLIYLPTQQGSRFPFNVDEDFEYNPKTWNTGVEFGTLADRPVLPEDAYEEGVGPVFDSPGVLLAWNPVDRGIAWHVEYDQGVNGGTLTTAGNLVFQGAADGLLRAYAADDGEKLWEVDLGVSIMAPPVTYSLDGKQYLSVLVGWGGSSGLIGPNPTGEYKPEGRLWTFAIGGEQDFEPVSGQPWPELTAIEFNGDPELLAFGEDQYSKRCRICHGGGAAGGGALADLRYSQPSTYDSIQAIVRQGAFTSLGMPNFGDTITEEEVEAIKHYILSKRAELLQQDLR